MDAPDPFAILGLPRCYELDAAEMQRKYLERSAALHPDLAGLDPAVEERAAALNRAREILEDPERRAVALWRLLGGAAGDDRQLPPGFLMEMMETREEIEAATASRDPAAIAQWERWAEEQRGAYQSRVAALFRGIAATGQADPETLAAIKQELNAWRYIERLIEQLDPDARVR